MAPRKKSDKPIDEALGDAAPKGADKPAQPSGQSRSTQYRKKAALKEGVNAQLGAIGLAVSAFDPVCGPAILAGADNLSSALANLAMQNDSVRKALEATMTASAWGEVMMAAAAIALPIMKHHNMIPDKLKVLPGGGDGGEEAAPRDEAAGGDS